MKNIVIIGGGASGLVAAIFAAKGGKKVCIIEKNNVCGKKILSTGNGRCNYWNEDQSISHYRSNNIDLVKEVLSNENKGRILEFFEEIGILPKIKNGYYYPFSNQAITMQRALILEAEKLNIDIKNNVIIKDIKDIGDKFIILTEDGVNMKADRIILATGSKAAPKTGSDGIGYKISEKFGHSIINPLPALVQLKANESFLKKWEGVRTDVMITLIENDKKLAEEKGEIQLTNYGVSGICIFNLSGRAARGLTDGKKEKLEINFLDGLNIKSEAEFVRWFTFRNQKIKNRTIGELLEGVLNYKLVNVLLKRAKLNDKDKWNEIDEKSKIQLAKNVIKFDLDIIGTNSFDKAQICSGGIPLNEIDTKTMESKKQKGLYIVGELLDVDGDCGGYNLEWAWITGMIAGINVE